MVLSCYSYNSDKKSLNISYLDLSQQMSCLPAECWESGNGKKENSLIHKSQTSYPILDCTTLEENSFFCNQLSQSEYIWRMFLPS